MSHTSHDQEKLLNRVRRIRGQVNAVERALEQGAECSAVLQTLVACRGAVNSLVVELLEDHIRFHIVDPDKRAASSPQAAATQELIDVLRTYFR
ncbi:MAG: metal/formaldehyde-sensitive transcriptional repressor [Acidobacteria bacterium]|nr:metal/formaldehyde-sensitive transcriptional repressor [Acidobacteriota bacterium]